MTAIANATDSSTVEKLIATVEGLQQTVKQQANRIDELENKLAEHKDHTGREFADVRSRITEVENKTVEGDSEERTPGVDEGKTGSQDAETPLERICALPEHLAKRELSVNQERARFVAKGISDYAEKAPAGLVIDSRTIKRVITASEEKRPHTQTVARIMNFLDDLGKDVIEQKKRRGRKLIVVDRKLADRLADHTRCDQETADTLNAGVIGST